MFQYISQVMSLCIYVSQWDMDDVAAFIWMAICSKRFRDKFVSQKPSIVAPQVGLALKIFLADMDQNDGLTMSWVFVAIWCYPCVCVCLVTTSTNLYRLSELFNGACDTRTSQNHPAVHVPRSLPLDKRHRKDFPLVSPRGLGVVGLQWETCPGDPSK